VNVLPPLRLAGNAYYGVGIADCVHSGEKAAEEVVAALATSPA
jgi:oxygen-dependent protoporphyrinogen oxidase